MVEKIACVVVTYNRKKLLRENLLALLKQTYSRFDILVIDNHSTDGTYTYIKDLLENERIIYINTGKNLGGAGGFQYGIKIALEKNYDYLWLMDDDSIPLHDSLSKLVDFAKKNPKFGFLCSKVIWKDHSMCKMNIPRTGLTSLLSPNEYDITTVPVIMGTFVSFFVSRRVIESVGLPIKEFFIWADDLEFSRRISKKHPCFYIGDSIVLHKCSSNVGANIVSDSYNRINRYFYAYRNETYLYKREGLKGYFHLVGRFPFHLMKVLVCAKNHKKERIGQLINGTIKGIKFNPKIEYPIDKRKKG